MYYGSIVIDGETMLKMFDDFADLWERAPPTTPSRDVVGSDPVEFAETFAQAYTGSGGSTRNACASGRRSRTEREENKK